MATTKIFDKVQRLDKLVDYVINPPKTELGLHTTSINCDLKTAVEEMNMTKQTWGKTDGIIAFHCIQSFKPGEVTPELAHKIGVELAQRMWGARFEVVVGTHLDRDHLHNHFAINSVSCADGLRYYDKKETYYGGIRKISDELCREYALSVVEHSKGHGKNYRELMGERAGLPTARDLLRADIDEVLPRCLTFQQFLDAMRAKGYGVKYGPTIQRPGIKPPGQKNHFRFYKLGEGYTEEDIKARLSRQLDGIEQEAHTPAPTAFVKPPRRYRCTTPIPRQRSRPLVGLPALTLHYMYILGKVKRRQVPTRAAYALRGELAKLRRYQQQFVFLHRNSITKLSELDAWEQGAQERILALTRARFPLYKERKAAPDEATADAITAKITATNDELRRLRHTVKVCQHARADAPVMRQVIQRVQEIERQPEQKKKPTIAERTRKPER